MDRGWHFEKEVSWSKMDLRYWLNPTVFAEGSPGRAAAIGFVKARYNNDIKRLNSAWGCRAASFDALSDCVSPAAHRWQCQRSGDTGWPPGVDSAQLTSDSEAFILVFAKKYFDVVSGSALSQTSPGDHLRMCWKPSSPATFFQLSSSGIDPSTQTTWPNLQAVLRTRNLTLYVL